MLQGWTSQETFPRFAEKYGVGGFLCIDSYLMSHYPRFLETSPCINKIIWIKESNEIIVQYDDGSNEIETVFVLDNENLKRVRNLYIIAVD